ncbi:MAG: nitroreductase family protein [Chitinophagales bacterium]|nr:nitroreductase family protein [Chitinophagales bacterium]
MSHSQYPFIPYHREIVDEAKMLENSSMFYKFMNERRTVRDFSDRSVSLEVMENIILTASTAPSGAHKQPWTFCLVSNTDIKKQIRDGAELEEYNSYHSKMSKEWLEDIAPLQTDWHKPFLEKAPWLIVIFKRVYEIINEKTRQNYYVQESVGIATGFLLAAIHNAGLAALTHTPSPMNFLSDVLHRPVNERPFLLIPVGYPANDCKVPELKRKEKEHVIAYY